nr:1790_t:CDS:2 [Entrophospora candida]
MDKMCRRITDNEEKTVVAFDKADDLEIKEKMGIKIINEFRTSRVCEGLLSKLQRFWRSEHPESWC